MNWSSCLNSYPIACVMELMDRGISTEYKKLSLSVLDICSTEIQRDVKLSVWAPSVSVQVPDLSIWAHPGTNGWQPTKATNLRFMVKMTIIHCIYPGAYWTHPGGKYTCLGTFEHHGKMNHEDPVKTCKIVSLTNLRWLAHIVSIQAPYGPIQVSNISVWVHLDTKW